MAQGRYDVRFLQRGRVSVKKKIFEYFLTLVFVGYVALIWLSIQLGFWFEEDEDEDY